MALVEIGAGVTNVSVFSGGMLTGLSSIPLGSSDITDDIASTFGTSRAWAERAKCFHGCANLSPRDNHETLDVTMVNAEPGDEQLRITKAQLIGVIRQRLDRLMEEIKRELARLKFEGPMGRQIVLTGGGAELKGMADYAQQALGCTVRLGRGRGLTAMPDAHAGAAFTTLAGLARYAAEDPVDLRTLGPSRQLVVQPSPRALFQRLVAAFRANY